MKDGEVLVEVVVAANVCPVAVMPFNVYNPLPPHVALPLPSLVRTAPVVVNEPPVTFSVLVTNDVAVTVPVLIEVDEIFPVEVKDVAVINPAAKPPLPSLLTIVFAVLEDVAEFTEEATVVIVDELTPPTLFTVGKSAVPVKSPVNFMIPLFTSSAPVAPIAIPLRTGEPIPPTTVVVISMPRPAVISSSF